MGCIRSMFGSFILITVLSILDYGHNTDKCEVEYKNL